MFPRDAETGQAIAVEPVDLAPEPGVEVIPPAGAAGGALEQARGSVSLLETLLDSLADGVFALDRRGRVIHWSGSLARLTGIGCAQALGRPGGELVGDLADRVIARERSAATGCLRLPDGGDLPVRVLAARASGPGGVLVGWVCAVTDLRGQWAAQAEAQRAEALAELGRGLAAALHQVRNPLGAAAGFAELLQRDLTGTPAARLMSRLRASLEEVDRRVGAVLAYARPRPLEVQEFDLSGLLAEVADQVRARFPAGPAIACEAPRPVGVRADRNQLRQALENLMVNACEAAGPAGQARVLLQGAGGVRDAAGRGVRVLVRNTGAPLAPERLREIFEPFRTAKSGGTGLGLALARRIAAAHGGRITALSAGGWTTFVLALPGDAVAGRERDHEEDADGELSVDAAG